MTPENARRLAELPTRLDVDVDRSRWMPWRWTVTVFAETRGSLLVIPQRCRRRDIPAVIRRLSDAGLAWINREAS